MTQPPPIRDAATVILLRDAETNPRILMGQRGANASFMPSKFVFPGGAVDEGDHSVPIPAGLQKNEAKAVAQESTCTANALAAAAIRETWEETGQILGASAPWQDAPKGWRGFARTGHRPDASRLKFVFRAVTPVGNPRRFDARFFLADAAALASDPDDFSKAEDELSHLHWVPLQEARALDLPFITEVVLAEIAARLNGKTDQTSVPFFRNDDEAHLITRLGGRSPLDV